MNQDETKQNLAPQARQHPPLPTLLLKEWRAYKQQTRFALKPMTLLYGHNQAGKSSLLRALPILAEAIYGNTGPLGRNSPAWLGAAVDHFAHNDKGRLSWGLENAEGLQFQVDWVRGLENWKISELHLTNAEQEWTYASGEAPAKGNFLQGLRDSFSCEQDESWAGELVFQGFWPQEQNTLPAPLRTLQASLRHSTECLKNLQWLHGKRGGAVQALGNAMCCDPWGSNLAAMLKEESEILRNAGFWLSRLLSESTNAADLKLKVVEENGQSIFKLERGGGNYLSLDVHGLGEGVRTLLPVLLCALWADRGRDLEQEGRQIQAPSMLLIEEMEAHLHPEWQIQLFELLLQTVRNGTPVILETHSPHVLRAMQRAVLQKQIPAGDIGLYWVEQKNGNASLISCPVGEDASLKNWRPETFEAEQRLAHEILDLRWQQTGLAAQNLESGE